VCHSRNFHCFPGCEGFDREIVDVQQVLPLPEATEYTVKVREKAVEKRAAERKFNFDFSQYDLMIGENKYQHLTKRALGFRILHAAVSSGSGITPEESCQRQECCFLVDNSRWHAEGSRVFSTGGGTINEVREGPAQPILL
jgi:hypothetical protein